MNLPLDRTSAESSAPSKTLMNLPDRTNYRTFRRLFPCWEGRAGWSSRAALSAARQAAGFSLVEMLAVIAVISVVAGFFVPAVKGLTGGNTVDTGAAELRGLLTLARSEAIAQHTIVRFVIATDWSGQETDADLRRVSLWSWHADTQCFLQLTAWQELPVGLLLEPGVPTYIGSARYANDPSTVHGDGVLGPGFADAAGFIASTNAGTIYTRYIEFLPTGSARIPGGSTTQAIFVATQGYTDANQQITYTSRANGQPTNWAQINVDTLTGRAQIYRP